MLAAVQSALLAANSSAGEWTPANLFLGGEEGGFWDFAVQYLAANSDGTGAISSGDNVRYARDLGPNGKHIKQANSTDVRYAPNFNSANGGSLDFDDPTPSDAYATYLNCSRVFTNDLFTVVVGVKASTQPTSARTLICQHNGLAVSGRIQFVTLNSANNKGFGFFNNGTSYSQTTTTVVQDGTYKTFWHQSDGTGNTWVRVNNGAAEGTTSGQTFTPLDTNFNVGSQVNDTTGDGGNGAICTVTAVFAIGRVLSDDERTLLQDWFATRNA